MSLGSLVELVGPGSIGHDEVEVESRAILQVVFEATKSNKQSTFNHLIDHGWIWVRKILEASKTPCCTLGQPESWLSVNFFYPLGYSLVEETIDSLQVHHLLLAKAKFRDVHVAL